MPGWNGNAVAGIRNERKLSGCAVNGSIALSSGGSAEAFVCGDFRTADSLPAYPGRIIAVKYMDISYKNGSLMEMRLEKERHLLYN